MSGEAPQNDCVTARRTVALELKTWLLVSVPRDWDENDINFFFNESSHCIGNEFRQIVDEHERGHCACFRTKARYLREATEEDHEDTGWNPIA